jgi:c-di-GMP-binding flagellar brake protein YcgR
MRDEASFSIKNSKEIVRHLFLLFKKKCLITASFGENNESYITTLLDIDEKNNAVIFDYGPNEDFNRRLFNSGKVVFDTDYEGIKVSFSGVALKKVKHKGDPVFSMPIPKSLYWLQRREYYRVKSPISKPSYCQLVVENREPVNLAIYDISLSGFSMLNVSKELSDLIIPGQLFEQCKLILLETDECLVSFEIGNKLIMNPDKLQKIQKIGCKLVKTTRSAEDVIQRYMHQLQRNNLQKE